MSRMKRFFFTERALVRGMICKFRRFMLSYRPGGGSAETPGKSGMMRQQGVAGKMKAFRNPALPLEERIDDLMSELTVDEKLGLLNYRNEGIPRLGIPPYVWWNEALHGLARSGSATVFPQAIAMAATFSPELVERMGEVVAEEGRARHFDAMAHGDFGTYKGLTYWSPNVNIFRDPLASVVKLEAVSPDLATVRLRFADYDRFPKQEVRVADLNRIDPETRRPVADRPLRIALEFYKGQNRPQTRWLEPNLLEVTAKAGTFRAAEAGETFLLRHYVYDLNGIDFRINRHLTLENVTIASAPGMGILTAGAQHHWQLLNCRIVPPAGSKRPCSTTADAMHTTSSAGFFRMENSELGFSCDDTMNFHDLNGFAERLDDHRIRLVNLNYHPGDYFLKGDLLELCNADFSPTGFRGKALSARRNGRYCEIEFAEKVPDIDHFIVLNRRFGTRNLIFRNNYIHDFPRGLLLSAENVTIENNRFERGIASGIKLETGYTLQVWSEGYGVRNIVIRNNKFERVNPIGRYPNENSPDIYINSYLGTDPSLRKSAWPIIRDVWITGNEFIDSTGSPVYICTADQVTVSGNRFVNRSELPVKSEARGAIGASDSGVVRIVNNVWESSLPGVKSGVLYDADTVKQMEFGGNTRK